MQAPGIMTANLHCLPDTLALFEKRLSDSFGTYVRVCGQCSAVTFIWTDWFIDRPFFTAKPSNELLRHHASKGVERPEI